MLILCPEFNSRAARVIYDHNAASDSDADQNGVLSFEKHDDPLQGLMERIEQLIQSGLNEDILQAYELARYSWQKIDFGAENEQKLQQTLAFLTAKLYEDTALRKAFSLKAIDVASIETREHQTKPLPSNIACRHAA